ncbi:MAG TPA: ethanolamine ammonia-lyase subunit EutC [Gemmataceae bacterium]|jgi:ethanolamine ammonia-lyase small subunit|nr:ethanolamine ammonia-lyase subunit EutC [Gemmataceae bacterium]
MADLSPRPTVDPLEQALARTPARLVIGRAGPAYRTATWLRLRADHAAARDAVHADVDLLAAFGADVFSTQTRATTKVEYLMRPDLGRRLDDASRALVAVQCPRGIDLQVVVGDGLSARAAALHGPPLLDALAAEARQRGWRFGRPFLVRHCRVGVLNDLGELLDPAVVVLLIGERPGLATVDSLSAYLAYRPRAGDTDAKRNLISNIHARGVSVPEACERIVALVDQMRRLGCSGVDVKEELAPPAIP